MCSCKRTNKTKICGLYPENSVYSRRNSGTRISEGFSLNSWKNTQYILFKHYDEIPGFKFLLGRVNYSDHSPSSYVKNALRASNLFVVTRPPGEWFFSKSQRLYIYIYTPQTFRTDISNWCRFEIILLIFELIFLRTNDHSDEWHFEIVFFLTNIGCDL